MFVFFVCMYPDREQQLHDLLACEARHKWADMSKVGISLHKACLQRFLSGSQPVSVLNQVLCEFDTDSKAWIYKKNLRGLLFTYSLPVTSDEFDQFWTR